MSADHQSTDASDTSMQEQSPQLADGNATRSPAERLSFGIALSILAVIVGLVVYVCQTEQEPPALSVRPKIIREAQGQFYVPFEVTNTGGETAEAVQIIAELRVNGQIEQIGEQSIDFLSGGETEEGTFILSRDPRQGELIVRAASYKIP
jgi:uncharacterized protein (TIGR02588 family)